MIDENTGRRRVLLKLSGEAFGGGQLGVNPDVVGQIAREIAAAVDRVEVSIVVGGGNSAGQAAIHLARFARSVTILVRRADLTETMSQ